MMKKFLHLLAKKERKNENVYDLGDVTASEREALRNIYRYRIFDSDSCNTQKPGFEVEVGCNEKGWKKEYWSGSNDSNPTAEDSDLESVDSNFHKSASAIVFPQSFPCSEKRQKNNCPSKEENNSKRNMYVINISNSKYFHIGSQKTININGKQLSSVQNYNAESGACDSSLSHKTDLSKILDCDEKLTESFIMLISLHISNQWENFLKNLGFEESFLEVMVSRNDHNQILTVYDALQKFITLFPSTNLNFVISVLIEIQQVALVEKLAVELKAVNSSSTIF